MPFQLNEETLIELATPLYIVVIGTEILLSHFQLKKYYTIKDTLTNIYLSLLNAGIDLAFRAIYLLIILQWFYVHRFVDVRSHPFIYWPLLFVLEDLVYYFEH